MRQGQLEQRYLCQDLVWEGWLSWEGALGVCASHWAARERTDISALLICTHLPIGLSLSLRLRVSKSNQIKKAQKAWVKPQGKGYRGCLQCGFISRRDCFLEHFFHCCQSAPTKAPEQSRGCWAHASWLQNGRKPLQLFPHPPRANASSWGEVLNPSRLWKHGDIKSEFKTIYA